MFVLLPMVVEPSQISEGVREGSSASIRHFKRRGILRPVLAPVIETRSGNIRVPQPFLHLGNVGLVIERICGSRGTQGMDTQTLNIANTYLTRIIPHHPIDAVRCHGSIEFATYIIAYRPKEGRGGVPAMAQCFNILRD
jgi:hypothetical protein